MIDMHELTVEDLGRTVLWRGGPPNHDRLFGILVAVENEMLVVQWNSGARTRVAAETLGWVPEDWLRPFPQATVELADDDGT